MRIVKYVLGALLALGAIATLAMFCVETSILGFSTTVSQIAFFVRGTLREPVILVPVLLIMGIPFTVLTVYGGDIAGSHMRRIVTGVCLMVALAALFAPVGIWAIARRTISYGPYLLLERGEYDRAMGQFEKLQATEPPETRPWRYAYEIAQCHYGKKEFSAAITLCKRYLDDAARSRSDSGPWMFLLMGDSYAGLGELAEARKCYSSCPKLVPNPDRRLADVARDHSLGGVIRGADYHP